MKIVSLVMNAATRDVRVVKAAKSLVAAGHEVRIFGIQDNNNKSPSALLDGNLEVRRVDWRTPVHHRISVIYTRLAVVAAILGGLGLAALLWLSRGLFSAAIGAVERFWAFSPPLLQDGGFWPGLGGLLFFAIKTVIILAVAALVVAVAFFALRRFVRFMRSEFIDRVGAVIARAGAAPGAEALLPARRPLWSLLTGRPKRAFGEFFSLANDRWTARSAKVARVGGMVELAEQAEADVIHCHEVYALPAAVALKQKTGAKIIYDAHELYEELAQAPQRTLDDNRRAHEQYLPFVDGVITVNDSIAAEYKRAYPFLPDPVVVKNATLFAPPSDYDGRLHAAAGLDSAKKILLYQGGFAAKRGLEELVRAAHLLPDDWSLVMMGWGAHEDRLQEIANEGVREWISEVLESRRREIKKTLPADLRRKLEKKLEIKILKNSSAASLSAPREPGQSAILDRFMVSRKRGGEASDPFAYEDDPVIAAQSETLNGLVNLRLNSFNIDQPLLENEYDKVRFIPPAPQDELPLWTQGASVGVIPYENDGLNHWFCSPNKLWEYPNASVPILASGFPELYKAVIGGGIGWVLPPDPKAADIARCVSRLSDLEIEQKKKACRDYIARDNWSVYEARLTALFDEVGAKAPVRIREKKSRAKKARKAAAR